jgi:DNA polymerase/3'-5' exonuclease PolX
MQDLIIVVRRHKSSRGYWYVGQKGPTVPARENVPRRRRGAPGLGVRLRPTLTDPEQLRADLDVMVEEERQGIDGGPEQEAKPWLSKLAQVESKRSRFQDMAAEGYITFEELGAKLSELEEIRTTAVGKLEAIGKHQERIEEMEKDRDTLLESYALRAPEALDGLNPEERHQVYRMLRLRAAVRIGGALEVGGMFGEGSGFCHSKTRS